MRVKELIEKLKTVDPELYVFVEGYEAGYDHAGFEDLVRDIQLDVHEEWYYGRHDDAREGSVEDVVRGIVLGRRS